MDHELPPAFWRPVAERLALRRPTIVVLGADKSVKLQPWREAARAMRAKWWEVSRERAIAPRPFALWRGLSDISKSTPHLDEQLVARLERLRNPEEPLIPDPAAADEEIHNWLAGQTTSATFVVLRGVDCARR